MHQMSSAQVSRGLRWPRFYDLMVLVLTRGRDRAYREKLLDLAGIGPGDNVLDIGSGTGTLAISAWRRARPTGSVTGTDISKPMLAAARRKSRRAGAEIAFMEADATSLPFADASFDVVLMTTVMHMVPTASRPKVLGEMARVLKPGGRALLVDYGGPLEARRKMSARHGPHGSFDLYRLKDEMKEAGFSNVQAGPTGWLDLHFLRGEAG
jgi:ubiquinone/menaquinone biosynthesis C-methylase UbiE